MAGRGRHNRLEDREVALIKAMIGCGRFGQDQDILAYFTRPGRTVNHSRIRDIRIAMNGEPMPATSRRFAGQPAATADELARFLAEFPDVDARTGLRLADAELLIKAREAMLFAVQGFNNPTTYFKAEMFIVAAIIAWTYLLHAFLKREGVDYIYRESGGQPKLMPQGQPRHYDLARCLKLAHCPLSAGEKRNLEYLLGIRHEIEHRCTSRGPLRTRGSGSKWRCRRLRGRGVAGGDAASATSAGG